VKAHEKGSYPFTLGTTSYIIPDDILPNVRILAPYVDDIELVLFESPELSNMPSNDNISEMIYIKKQYSTGYTVHLPTDKKAGSENIRERIKFCDDVKKVIELTYPLNPRAWILHLEGITKNTNKDGLARWTDRCFEVLKNIDSFIEDTSLIAIENLGYPWVWHENLAEQFNMSLCCDVGHLWLNGHENWIDDVKQMLSKTIVVHLHGVCSFKDHVGLQKGDRKLLKLFLNELILKKYKGVITLEIFNGNDFFGSMEALKKEWELLH